LAERTEKYRAQMLSVWKVKQVKLATSKCSQARTLALLLYSLTHEFLYHVFQLDRRASLSFLPAVKEEAEESSVKSEVSKMIFSLKSPPTRSQKAGQRKDL
jgi:hypothetical protein